MRLKYYLRGAGIGIIVTSLILTVAFAFSKNTVSDEEIIRRAEAMGYVKAENLVKDKSKENAVDEENVVASNSDITAELNESSDIAEKLENENTAEKQDEVVDSNSNDKVVTYVPFTISSGQSSNDVAMNLYKAGLVDDSTAFNQYMSRIGVDSKIQAGTFYVRDDASYDDLVAILVTKQGERENVNLPENGEIVE